MQTVIGPVLTREGGYAFDAWSRKQGLQRGYTYRRIEDAHYARKFEISCRKDGRPDNMLACNTADEFARLTIASGLIDIDAMVGPDDVASNGRCSNSGNAG